MLINPTESQLVLVDYQQRLMPAIHDGEAVSAVALRLARIAALLDIPIWGTEENPQALGPNLAAIRALCQRTLSKMHFSACADGLLDWLQAPAPPAAGNARSLPRHLQKPATAAPTRHSIVLAGCEAHVCLLQTALDLLAEEEWDVWVVTDACGSQRSFDRDAAFDRLASSGAELVSCEMLAFEWLGSAQHPRFKEVLALLKA